MSKLKNNTLYQDALIHHLVVKGYNYFEAKGFVDKMFETTDNQFNIDFFHKVMEKGKSTEKNIE